MVYARNVLRLLIVVFPMFGALGQITLTDAVFPRENVRHIYGIDTSVVHVLSPASSLEQVWDFRQLDVDLIQVDSLLPGTDGTASDSFPTADIIIRMPGGAEQYLSVDSENVYLLGLNFAFLNTAFPVVLSEPQTLLTNPLNFDDRFTGSATTNRTFALSDFPELDTLINDNFPIPGGRVDSVRLTYDVENETIADAWGQCMLPTATYDVLRLKQTAVTTVSIELYVVIGIIGLWQNLGDLIEDLPIPDGDTTHTFTFWSDQSDQPILSFQTAESDTAFALRFKTDVSSGQGEPEISQPDMHAFPNPVSSNVVFLDVPSEGTGVYTWQILGVKGRLLIDQQISLVSGVNALRLESKLPAGPYIYRLIPADRGKQTSVHLIVIE